MKYIENKIDKNNNSAQKYCIIVKFYVVSSYNVLDVLNTCIMLSQIKSYATPILNALQFLSFVIANLIMNFAFSRICF